MNASCWPGCAFATKALPATNNKSEVIARMRRFHLCLQVQLCCVSAFELLVVRTRHAFTARHRSSRAPRAARTRNCPVGTRRRVRGGSAPSQRLCEPRTVADRQVATDHASVAIDQAVGDAVDMLGKRPRA